MKRLALNLSVVFLVLFSMNTIAGEALRNLGNLDPGVTQPNSNAFGKSLDAWMEVYIRWLEDGADPDARVKNAAFLPILGESPFAVEVEAGTALVLPIATWLGFPGDPILPEEWWGDPNHIFGDVTLDGQPIAIPNEDYYVGPTDLVPPAILFGIYEIDFYQALVVVINPLTPGDHQIVLHSEFVDLGLVFDNTWNISVVRPGKS
ncbi:hypothetical protein [Kaarinaea lacus]